jgi:hypothetical protein
VVWKKAETSSSITNEVNSNFCIITRVRLGTAISPNIGANIKIHLNNNTKIRGFELSPRELNYSEIVAVKPGRVGE